MEPTLLVIGLNHRTAPIAMRERFWIPENGRAEALRRLHRAEGVEEILILTNDNRTEFLLWAGEPTLAASSLLHFLTEQHGLKLSEWEHFYRLLDEAAMIHLFRVACGLDSMALGEPGILEQIKASWQQARALGTCGRFFKRILDAATEFASRMNLEGAPEGLIPCAAAELASRIFESIQGRGLLLLGASEMGERTALRLIENGAVATGVTETDFEHARQSALKLGATVVPLERRSQLMLQADIVICSSEAAERVLTSEEAERIAVERDRKPLVIIDISMPRRVEPTVRRVDGILLCDLDGLERIAKRRIRPPAVEEAEKVAITEAQAFHRKMRSESVVPTIVALRRRLDEICRQELESFTEERGPFTREQDQALHAITAQVIQKIAGSLARELKGLPEEAEQQQMTAALHRLFHLETPNTALAGATLERSEYEQSTSRVLATR